MSLEVTTKQSYFTSLPWVAAGIAVSIYNEEQGREHARKVLYSFDEVCRKHGPQLTALLHHRVSRLWLHHDSPLRHEINSFVQGQRLKELPRLSRFCGEMILIPIVERRQEGAHSVLSKSHVYKNSSLSNLSLSFGAADALGFLRSETHHKSFSDYVKQFSRIMDLAKAFGYDRHPWMLKAVRQWKQEHGERLNFYMIMNYAFYSDAPEDRFPSIRKSEI